MSFSKNKIENKIKLKQKIEVATFCYILLLGEVPSWSFSSSVMALELKVEWHSP